MSEMRKELCPTCKNDEWGYFKKDWGFCLRCGRLLYRPDKEYNLGTVDSRLFVDYIFYKTEGN